MILETVPNVSEGRNPPRVERLARAVGSLLLDVHSDPDHHRSVLSAAGRPEEVEEAVRALAVTSIEEIDLRHHAGVHPRLGALDVVPVVPLRPEQEETALETAARLGRVLSALRLGVYRYGLGARTLPEVRARAAEGAPPDVGTPHPTAGSVCLGVRPPLVAFNVDFDPRAVDASLARALAAGVRQPAIRALGLVLPAQGRAQVSMNLIDPGRVGLESAWRLVRDVAASLEVPPPVGAELVGLAPRAALEGLSEELARLTGVREKVLEDRI